MHLQSKHIDNILVGIVQAKRATLADSDELRNFLIGAIESGTDRIVMDLSHVEFIDSSFLGAMMAAMKRLAVINGDLKICTGSEQIVSLLKITRLNRIFSVYPSISVAVSSFDDTSK